MELIQYSVEQVAPLCLSPPQSPFSFIQPHIITLDLSVNVRHALQRLSCYAVSLILWCLCYHTWQYFFTSGKRLSRSVKFSLSVRLSYCWLIPSNVCHILNKVFFTPCNDIHSTVFFHDLQRVVLSYISFWKFHFPIIFRLWNFSLTSYLHSLQRKLFFAIFFNSSTFVFLQ